MFIKRISLVFILAVIFTLLFPASALAVPQLPHQFYGEVTIGGGPATDGLLVEAKINHITYGTSTTHGGTYGLNYDTVINLMQVVADDPDTPGIEGGAPEDTIEFWVDGVKAEEEYTFARGGYTELDLTVVEIVPPEVVSTSPADTAIDVAVEATVNATFSEAMDSATITAASFTLSDGGAVSGAVSYNPATLTATFAPDADLGYSTAYTATITTAVTDLAGNPLAALHSWGFTTVDLVEPATVTVAVVGDPLTEENLDGSQITATVAEDTYVADIVTDHFTLTAPAGTTVASVERTSDTVATLTLAFDGTDFDVDDTLGVTVAADALTTSTEAVVSENTLPITATVESAPVASFEVSATVAVVDETVEFTDTSEFADSWLWDFGDDITSTEQNPTHAYAEKGIYTVTLTVSNILGDAVAEAYIIVVPAIAGEPGAAGADGAVGAAGIDGVDGAAGADGVDGLPGADGVDGLPGADGATGATGAAGAPGAAGAQGEQGVAGAPGAAGAQGEQGVAGAPGAAGAQGEQGVAGAPGAAGATGEAGEGASKALPIVALILAIAALLGVGITILRKG